MREDFPKLDTLMQGVPPFLALSARLGRDPAYIQASGGNTSFKDGGRLWIKASGKVLSDAETDGIFVALDLDGVRQAIRNGDADPVSGHVIGKPGLRPSIETTLHALLPHRFVFHVHAVEALAWTVREDGRDRVAERLDGVNWAWVPYARPVLPLTRATEMAARRNPDVLVLGNHGLVLGGATCDEVERRIAELARRLESPSCPPAKGPSVALRDGLDATRFRLPEDGEIHILGRDPAILELARTGPLYPDHVVFLGPVMPVAASVKTMAQVADEHAARLGEPPACILVAGHGVALAGSTRFGAEPMLRCLADVLSRVPPGAALRYLTAPEIAELVNWDAEKYRKALHR